MACKISDGRRCYLATFVAWTNAKPMAVDVISPKGRYGIGALCDVNIIRFPSRLVNRQPGLDSFGKKLTSLSGPSSTVDMACDFFLKVQQFGV